MLEWTPEAIDAEMSYRNELRRIREAQGIYGRPVPLVPWWRRRTRSRKLSQKPSQKSSGKAQQKVQCTSAQTR